MTSENIAAKIAETTIDNLRAAGTTPASTDQMNIAAMTHSALYTAAINGENAVEYLRQIADALGAAADNYAEQLAA